MFRVGTLEYPQDDDKRFETQEEAEIHGINLSASDVIAVWDDTTEEGDVDGEVVALIYQYVVYSP